MNSSRHRAPNRPRIGLATIWPLDERAGRARCCRSRRNVIGIELPNRSAKQFICARFWENDNSRPARSSWPLILGKDIGGLPVVADLARMPHLLVAGTTGSGKSVAINTMILSRSNRLAARTLPLIIGRPQDAGTLSL